MNSSKTNSRRILSSVSICLIGLLASTALAGDLEKLADANTGFAFDLLKQIAKEQPGQNIFISPFSVSTVLQMVGDGAVGETKVEMQRVLKTTDLSAETLNAACKDLNQSLNSQTNVILNLVNAIWHENWIHLTPAFVSDNQDFFQVEIAGVDSFTNTKSADIINDWADKKTHGKIKQVVRFPFPASTRVVLANAIYFKGKWAEPFDKSQTKPRDFHLYNGGEKQVPMMRQSRTFSYQEGDDFQAVRLPYAGDRLQMFLFLPATNSNPQKLLANLNSESWYNKILPRFSDRKGTLVFPKFKLDYNILLNDSLEALGMKRAFQEGVADFSRMVDNDSLFITIVKQKSFVDVNEEGTEAAAVTTVMLSDSAMPLRPPKPFEMIVDRPFVFVIEDSKTQSILFMGTIFDPAGQGGGD
jgi:serine protease inhibitor